MTQVAKVQKDAKLIHFHYQTELLQHRPFITCLLVPLSFRANPNFRITHGSFPIFGEILAAITGRYTMHNGLLRPMSIKMRRHRMNYVYVNYPLPAYLSTFDYILCTYILAVSTASDRLLYYYCTLHSWLSVCARR